MWTQYISPVDALLNNLVHENNYYYNYLL